MEQTIVDSLPLLTLFKSPTLLIYCQWSHRLPPLISFQCLKIDLSSNGLLKWLVRLKWLRS